MPSLSADQNKSLYLVDAQYRLLYFNHRLGQLFPDLKAGDLCYKVLCGEDAPCESCPLSRPCQEQSIFYNKRIHGWVEVNTAVLDWPGVGPCSMVLTKRLQEDNKNLFYSLTSLSSYDELISLNLTRDTFTPLYHKEGKYDTLPDSGSCTALVRLSAGRAIHPDDRESFLRLWSPPSLLSRLEHGGSSSFVRGQFRRRCVDGSWRWTLQTGIPLQRGPHDDLVVMCFVQDIHDQRVMEQSMLDLDQTGSTPPDPLTGLCLRPVFFQRAETLLRGVWPDRWCLVALDINHFKLYNEWYGLEAGNQFLAGLAQVLLRTQQQGGLAGYFGADDFAILLPNQTQVLDAFQQQIFQYIRQSKRNAGFLPAFGFYAVEDLSIPLATMYDRACLALDSVRGSYSLRARWYQPDMTHQMEQTMRLITQVQQGLERREFTFYAQAKCNMATGKIVGLESLVRWNHPERGLVPPGDFIPQLENSGFIVELDMFVWELVCQWVRDWIDRGRRPIPISVNVSRVDIYTLDVVKHFQQLTGKYGLDPGLIEIEITESAYAEEYELISQVADGLRKSGFTVLMDDFGSGYSSLNMLKDTNVDVLKLDMKFLDIDAKSAGKGLSILESVVSMAHMVGLRVIAEGVETRAQMDLLLNLGCLYGQGYHFYRPMPLDVFEPLLANERNVDFRGIQARRLERLDVQTLLNRDLFSETLVNNILGGVAFYEVCEDSVTLRQVNEQYYRITGSNPADLGENYRHILDAIYQEDRAAALDVFRRARQDILNGAEGTLRRLRADGTTLYICLHAFFLREQDGCQLFYGSVSDVTRHQLQERQLESSQRALSAVVHISEHDQNFLRLSEENRRIASSIFAQMSPGGMIGGYCEDGFPLYFANHAMVKLLGYEDYDELERAIGGMVGNTIHPDDLNRVMQDIGPCYYAGLEYTTIYRMPRKDGAWFWTLDKGRVVQAEDGRLAIVSACTDISEPMRTQQQLAEQNAMLLRQNQELNFLNNDMPGGYHRCLKTPDLDFSFISNRFLDIFGYTRLEIKELFDDKFRNMVHPDDRATVDRAVHRLAEGNPIRNLEYRVLSKRGYLWVTDQSRYLEYGGLAFLQGVVLDVNEAVESRNHLQFMMRNAVDNLVMLTFRGDGGASFHVLSDGLYRSLGYSREEYESWLDSGLFRRLTADEDQRRLDREMIQAIRARRNYQDTIRIHLPKGDYCWFMLIATFVREEEDGACYLCMMRDVTPFKQAEEQLRRTKENLELVLRQAGINFWSWDMESGVLTIAATTPQRRFSYLQPSGEPNTYLLRGFPDSALSLPCIPSGHHGRLNAFLEQVLSGEGELSCELPITAEDGSLTWFQITGQVIPDPSGHPIRAEGYYTDITQQKNEFIHSRENMKALELLRSQALYDFRINLNGDALTFGKDQTSWTEETGYSGDANCTGVLAHGVTLLLPEWREPFRRFCSRKRMLSAYHRGVQSESLEYQRMFRGKPKWLRMVAHYTQIEGLPDLFAYLFVMDIDAQKNQELQLTRMAETDALTGMYNRQAAISRIKSHLAIAPEESAALIMLDLDNFKLANDVFGHAYGDAVLAQTAHRIKAIFQEEDILCRLGGDEFLVLCRSISPQDIDRKLSGVIETLASSRSSHGRTIRFSVSAGYAVIPEDGTDFDELYGKADIALFAVKMAEKGSCRKYDPSMQAIRYQLAGRGPT